MNKSIKQILEELYETDPSLKKEESSFVSLLKKIRKNKPEASMSSLFKENLRELLQKEEERGKLLHRGRKIIFTLGGTAAALLTAALILPVMIDKYGGTSEEAALVEELPRAMEKSAMDSMDSLVLESEAPPQMMGFAMESDYGLSETGQEEYSRIYENSFLSAMDNPLSTFSIDVDTASYANVRRFVNSGTLPPIDVVRIEELINYFPYNLPEPTGSDPLAVNTVLSRSPWNEENMLLKVGIQGRKIYFDDLPPNNLVFLLDVSGSMNNSNKLPLLKKAMKMIVTNMREEDSIAICVYAGAAGTVLPPTGGDRKLEIINALDRLEAGGSTAGAEGIELAYHLAEKNFDNRGNNRIILATDGDFNVGPSSESALNRMIETKRDSGTYLTVLGFGTGNIKDSKMEMLADKGNGNYAYIDTLQEARKVLVEQMGGTFFTIAEDVKLQLEFNPALVGSYRLIGYENRMLAREDFEDDRKDAGELGAGHSVTALYEIIPADGTDGGSSLKYQENRLSGEALSQKEMMTVKLRYKNPGEEDSLLLEHVVYNKITDPASTDDDFRFAASVAMWGMLLRDSQYSGNSTYDTVLELAQQSKGEDPAGYRGEFIRLVSLSRELDRLP
jgi:Ca-activated chloride channel family protein